MHKTNTPPPVRLIRKSVTAITAAILLGMGLAAAPANADTTTTYSNGSTDPSTLPDHIVNGDFEYPYNAGWSSTEDGSEIDPVDGWGGFYSDFGWKFKPIPNFDRSKFGWDSTQTGLAPDKQPTSAQRLRHSVQSMATTDNGKRNMIVEMCAEQEGTAIYQDVATIPGAVYTWHLDHMSLSKSHKDSMSVMIGKPGEETAQQAYRETVNGGGDKVGPVGTVISTQNKTDKRFNDSDPVAYTPLQENFEHYSGKYVVPAGQTVTRFTFKTVTNYAPMSGNMLDNVSFEISYPLHYDLKGGSGTAPQQRD